jgi:glutathione synthase/RimK-type ligase-like ATP-grasp enzyme
MPRTIVIHRDNVGEIAEKLGFPCVLKKPDSAFSLGVTRVESEQQLDKHMESLLAESDLVVAQEYLPTTFDWRIGIIAGQPIFACKYYMAPNHWQIVKRDGGGRRRYGRCETLPVELAPRSAVQVALKAANGIGTGLYGVDVKQSGKQCFVIEVNDNPNIDAGEEDAVLKQELYRRIMNVFLRRIEHRKSGVS